MRRSVVWPAVALALAVLLIPGIAAADCNSFSDAQQRGWGWMYLASFGFGFQTSLTPCVYPMIPIWHRSTTLSASTPFSGSHCSWRCSRC